MTSRETKAAGRVLLPDAVQPIHYDLRFTPDLERFSFDGIEKIKVEVKEATDEISLHINDIAIKHDMVVFTPSEGEAAKPEVITYKPKDSTVTFKFPEMLVVGDGTLELHFVGNLNDQMAGFYRSSYKDIKGNAKIMASTQFESLDARRAFPCWDEPARKAVFAVTLVVDAGLTAFSNMPPKTSKILDGGKKLELSFMDSPKMSTYLLAFVVGEFDFLQAQTKHGVQVRVYTPPGRVSDGEFPLKVAVEALDGYDDYFGVPYPLPKLDMVAIPEFAAGAMENWGLVTYREVDLLITPGASRQQLQRVCIVVTHELAHQWFGNLVTMTWWDDLWLNEGFASWCENYMADVIFPDYCMWDQFVSDTQAAALRLDGMRSSHPIQVPILRAEEVEEVFDAISYCKGAAVIKMVHAFLGAEDFQKGLRQYMDKHKYGNTETHDLWEAWTAASGKNISELMGSWTEQMGFPLVSVTNFDGSKLELAQSWFVADGSEVKPEEEKLWKIPFMCHCGTGSTCEAVVPPCLMTDATHTQEVPKGDFIVINPGRHVPMRVLYTPDMYKALASAVEKGALSAVDRAGLVLDAYALVKAGKLGPDTLFSLFASFKNETSYTVWDALSQALVGFDNILMAGASDAIYDHFVKFCGKLISNVANQVGWEKKDSDGHLDGMLRETVISLLARFSKDEAVVAEARRRFDNLIEGDGSLLPDDIKEPVFKIVLKRGGEKEYKAMRSLHDKAETNIQKKHVFVTIGHIADMALKKDVLEWAVSGEIKIQDFFYPVGSVCKSSKAAVPMTWEFFKSNFEKIGTMLKAANPSLMDAMITYAANGFCHFAAADEVESFFKENPRPQNNRTIKQVLEGVRANAAFLERVLKTPANTEAFWQGL